ncbi:DUF4489 domain-containing protein [Sedimentibacter sp.]|uniref:DUF4489 domain-containing protein n=1 Tax=Sedimentibacter sp. TaxID=1960295 RepID=UPI0028ADA888|nr:DUF4489 domain-containing protein [Sedimentibacter sp.]
MNLDSKYPMHAKTVNFRQDKDCDCKHPSGNKVIFEISYGNLGPLDLTFDEVTSFQTINQPVASVAINTSCEAVRNVIIEFTGILNVTTTVSATSTLAFTLFRICKDTGASQPLSTVSYLVADIFGGITTSHTLVFRFPICDDDCQDCCTYVLELSNIYNLDFGTITYAVNGTLSALAIVSAD